MQTENVLRAGTTDPRPGWRLADFGIAHVLDRAAASDSTTGISTAWQCGARPLSRTGYPPAASGNGIPRSDGRTACADVNHARRAHRPEPMVARSHRLGEPASSGHRSWTWGCRRAVRDREKS